MKLEIIQQKVWHLVVRF